MADDDQETEISQVDTKPESKVTDSDLNVLRDQIKRKDQEIAIRDKALEEERKRSQTSNARLGDEMSNRFSAETIAIENAILAASTELDSLEKQQADLYEEGKIAEASKLNRMIAAAAVKLEKGEDQKRTLESHKVRIQSQIEQQKSDPLAAYSSAARNWISAHPQFLSNESYKAKAMAAHYSAQADGITLDSPEYFNRLTNAVEPKVVINDTHDDAEDDVPEEKETVVKQQPRQAAKSSTAAPVSRDGNSNRGSGAKGGRVQLTPDEAEAAVISRPDLPKEEAYRRYFSNKQRAIADGKLGRIA